MKYTSLPLAPPQHELRPRPHARCRVVHQHTRAGRGKAVPELPALQHADATARHGAHHEAAHRAAINAAQADARRHPGPGCVKVGVALERKSECLRKAGRSTQTPLELSQIQQMGSGRIEGRRERIISNQAVSAYIIIVHTPRTTSNVLFFPACQRNKVSTIAQETRNNWQHEDLVRRSRVRPHGARNQIRHGLCAQHNVDPNCKLGEGSER